MTMFLDKLHAVSHEDSRHLGKLCLLLAVEEAVVQGEGELLQDGEEDPVVQGQVAVGVAEDEPPGQGGVGPCQLPLDGVLGEDEDGLPAELPGPGEGGRLQVRECQKKNNMLKFPFFFSFP